MARPLTLFTGQWADMKLEDLAPLAKKMGYEGLEIALTANHFDMTKPATRTISKAAGTFSPQTGSTASRSPTTS